MCIFKDGFSSLSDGWETCKEKAPDASDSYKNDETTCNPKLKFIKRFHQSYTEKLVKDELCM